MVPELPGLGGSGGFLEGAPGALLKSAPELLLLAP
jgi:hypothetical protein